MLGLGLELGDPLSRGRPCLVANSAHVVSGNRPQLGPGSSAASSTSNQRESLPSSDQIAAIAGRE